MGKKSSMAGCLQSLSAKGALAASPRPSVISIGDSDAEQQALKALLSAPMTGKPFCKTVKLMDEPNLMQLGQELKDLQPLLESLASGKKDFDLCIAMGGGVFRSIVFSSVWLAVVLPNQIGQAL